jgi:hypothetical protein
MGGETTATEVIVARLDAMAAATKEDFTEVKARLDRQVSREVYDAHRAADLARVIALEKMADDYAKARKADADKAEDARRQTRRHLWGAVIIPILLFIWGQWIAARGGKI